MSNIQIFNNEQFGEVRTIRKDDQIWFVAKDVCDSLNIKNTTDTIKRLDDDERTRFNLGRAGKTNFVNEFGLYNLVLGSRKEEAKQFKRWITHEVIPSIRKTGSYSIKSEEDKLRKDNAVLLVEMLEKDMDELGIDTHSKLAVKKSILEQSGIEVQLAIPAPTEEKFISIEEIARRVGIYSSSGRIHSQAVGAILEELNIDDDRKTITSGSNGSHTFSQTQYEESVVDDVKDYIINMKWPERIEVSCRSVGYNVKYD